MNHPGSGDTRGTATVEAAIILPLLILLALGTTDLGRLFYDAVAVSTAARAGLSYGSLDEGKAQDSSKIVSVAVADSYFVDDVTVTSERICECADQSVVDCETGTCAEGTSRIYVKVSATTTFDTIIPYPGIPDSVTITRDAYMRAR